MTRRRIWVFRPNPLMTDLEEMSSVGDGPPSPTKDGGSKDPTCARWKISSESKGLLEQEFNRKRFPSPRSKKRLAEELDVEPRRIQVWFQNRRQREKVGPEETRYELSELQSSLERYPPPRDSHMGLPPVNYLSQMDSGFGNGHDDPLLLGGGPYGLGDERLRGRPAPSLPSDIGSDWGDTQPFGRTDAYPVNNVGEQQGAAFRGRQQGCMPGVLSSSDDIVHALMEFDCASRPGGGGFAYEDLGADLFGRPGELEREAKRGCFDGSLCGFEQSLQFSTDRCGGRGSGSEASSDSFIPPGPPPPPIGTAPLTL